MPSALIVTCDRCFGRGGFFGCACGTGVMTATDVSIGSGSWVHATANSKGGAARIHERIDARINDDDAALAAASRRALRRATAPRALPAASDRSAPRLGRP